MSTPPLPQIFLKLSDPEPEYAMEYERQRLDGEGLEHVSVAGDEIQIRKKDAHFYNVAHEPKRSEDGTIVYSDPGTWQYDERLEEEAEVAFLNFLYWSRPASERATYMNSSSVEEEELKHWNPRVSNERKEEFVRKMKSFFSQKGLFGRKYTPLHTSLSEDEPMQVHIPCISTDDPNERLYSARLEEGSVSKADVAVARYLKFLQMTEPSYNAQMESTLLYEGEEWHATEMFLDHWQPFFPNEWRPVDNAFLLPEYKTNGKVEPLSEGEKGYKDGYDYDSEATEVDSMDEDE